MVLVCHDHKFIFLKTRKTAGTSIEMLLEPLCTPPGRTVTERTSGCASKHGIVGFRLLGEKTEPPSVWRSHMPAYQVRRELPREQWQTYRKLSCLRNPFDRSVSLFFWLRDAGGLPPFSSLDAARAAFRRFILEGNMKADKSIVHRKGKFILDGFIRFEALVSDTAEMAERLGLPVNAAEMPRSKDKTSRLSGIPVSDYFDTETARATCDQLAWMFEHGGYSRHPEDANARKPGKADPFFNLPRPQPA
ncbi:sulfotransferase family protein [Leisingera thetidis]|uniref:sulfotransferase family protein n=1 Tax=Leisingera thetidis TaxID=2930199 RepID=UPI0021F78E90|nr:sulfotransferase family protein [Leisingera thetidis]